MKFNRTIPGFCFLILVFGFITCDFDEEQDDDAEPIYSVLTLVLNHSAVNLRFGKSETLIPELKGPGSENINLGSVSWATSNSAVVQVNQDGIITARDRYYAIPAVITASANGLTGTCIVNVVDPGVNANVGASLNIYDDFYSEKYPGYSLVWGDEFEYSGKPDISKWDYERGYVRNNELQYYREENANVSGGRLVIHGEPVSPQLRDGSRYFNYASASIHTKNKYHIHFGIIEIRARIPITSGCWPAAWTLGARYQNQVLGSLEWPAVGEVDIMEMYRSNNVPNMHANWCWRAPSGTWNPTWNAAAFPLSSIALWHGENMDQWAQKFHVWRYVWTEDWIEIWLDNVKLNDQDAMQSNPSGVTPARPFQEPHFFIMNLAMGSNGGTLPGNTDSVWPLLYEVDYVRVYQKN